MKSRITYILQKGNFKIRYVIKQFHVNIIFSLDRCTKYAVLLLFLTFKRH